MIRPGSKKSWFNVLGNNAVLLGLGLVFTTCVLPNIAQAADYEEYTPPVADQGFSVKDNSLVCQQIKPKNDTFSSYVDLAITSTASSTVTLTIRSNIEAGSGKPGDIVNTFLATTNTNDDYITSNGKMLRFNQQHFKSTKITADQYYWLCLQATASDVKWIYGRPGSYGNGFMIYNFDGGNTLESYSDGDFGFKANSYPSGNTTSTTTAPTSDTGSTTPITPPSETSSTTAATTSNATTTTNPANTPTSSGQASPDSNANTSSAPTSRGSSSNTAANDAAAVAPADAIGTTSQAPVDDNSGALMATATPESDKQSATKQESEESNNLIVWVIGLMVIVLFVALILWKRRFLAERLAALRGKPKLN